MTTINDENEIARILLKLGFQLGLKGFRYLEAMIKMTLEDETCLYNFTNNACMKVAKKFNTQPKAIERAMRTPIDICWKERKEELQNISFVKLNYKPTIKEFISIIVAYLKYTNE